MSSDSTYSEAAPNYQFEDPSRTWRLTNSPLRIRYNPLPKVCTNPQDCTSVENYKFQEWMLKEWGVYIAQLHRIGEEVSQCWRQHHRNIIRDQDCMLKLKVYESMINEDNLKKAKQLLRKGIRLVPLADDWEKDGISTPNNARKQ